MEPKPTQEEVDEIRKFKISSITAQLQLDLPNRSEDERAKYMDLLEIMLDGYMVMDLEVNGGKENFTRFIDLYADRLLAWKLEGKNE